MLCAIHYLNGMRCEWAKDWTGAARYYQRALATISGRRWSTLHFRLGFVRCRSRLWAEAIPALEAAVALRPTSARWRFRLARAYEGARLWKQAIASYEQASELGSDAANTAYRCAQCWTGMKKGAQAIESLRTAATLSNNQPEYLYYLADSLYRQQKYWQVVEPLEAALKADGSKVEWHARLAEVYMALRRFDAAVLAYRQTVERAPSVDSWQFGLGRALELSGQAEAAKLAYAQALLLTNGADAKRCGIGVFHERCHDYAAATRAYREALRDSPNDPQLWHRLAMVLDRRHLWQDAEAALETALTLAPQNPEWHYRLGFVRERMGAWDRAAPEYEMSANTMPRHTPHHFYRQGYVLARAGRYEEACRAFVASKEEPTLATLSDASTNADSNARATASPAAAFVEKLGSLCRESLENHRHAQARAALARQDDCLEADPWSPVAHYLKGNAFERLGDWNAAAECYASAIERNETHQAAWHYRLGFVLYAAKRYEEATKAFVSTRVLHRPHGVPRQQYDKDSTLRARMDYVELYDTLPLRKKTILYESFHGARMACSPYAIFKHLLQHSDFSDWTHVWVLNDKTRIPKQYKGQKNIVFVSKESFLYTRYLAEAEILINNSTFPPYFIRKENQRYLNTWHGTPLKSLGKDIKSEFFEHKNTARNFLQATHLLSPNPHTTSVLLDRHDIRAITTAQVAETGYPRVDLTLNMSAQEKATLRHRLGIAPGTRVALYAPTFRGTLSERRVDVSSLLLDIRAFDVPGCHLLFRGHYFVEEQIASSAAARSIVPDDIDTNELLAIVDVLVTDYSSVSFDFMATGRPIVYYVADREAYSAERGFYFDMDVMPGEKCLTRDATREALVRALRAPPGITEERQAGRDRFAPYEDGRATERAVRFLFHDEAPPECIVPADKRRSLLFFAGNFMPNGITDSCLNLLHHIDLQNYSVTVVIDPPAVEEFPERLSKLQRLPEGIQVLGKAGRMLTSLEENWVLARFEEQNGNVDPGLWKLFGDAHAREYRRIFGAARFDVVVNFDGYNRFWPSVFAFGAETYRMRSAIYLHNDMVGEWTLRFPKLEATFRLYPHFTALVAVSELTSKLNRDNLAGRFGIDPEKFTYCDNLHNPERIRALAREPIAAVEHEELFSRAGTKFITMGRLSPEKDQAKLIEAFSEIHAAHPSVQLFILGDGPLRSTLAALVARLGLQESVHLLGHQENPFPYLHRSDCFVLSSNHEGQPMVLFEAMILGKLVVATDIPGNRSAVEGRAGMLVENSRDGLVAGLRAALEGRLRNEAFDYDVYRKNALAQFYRAVVGEPALGGGT